MPRRRIQDQQTLTTEFDPWQSTCGNDGLRVVTKRKVSGVTVGEDGRRARDATLGLVKTCRKSRSIP